MGTMTSGREAERRVAFVLEQHGHSIAEMNWRTRHCEIDIVSTQHRVVYFTEVKYRSSSSWGSGAEYVQTRKIKQMHLGARMWMAQHEWRGDASLQVADVRGDGVVKITVLDGSETT